MQDLLFDKIKKEITDASSITDEIATVLDLHYDAAYRRIVGRTKLSLNEAYILSNYYNIPLDSLSQSLGQGKIFAEVSPYIKDIDGLEQYFKTSLNHIKKLKEVKNASIVYSAKDIPLFYTLKDSFITKFKCYVWLKFLDEDGSMKKSTFQCFINSCPKSLFDAAHQLGEIYNYIDIVEFWNDNTINGTLQQVEYYFDSGAIDPYLATVTCEDILSIIDHVENQCNAQLILGSKNGASYKLYKSDLLTMSNTIMIRAGGQKVFFTPFTVLTYLKIDHKDTCNRLATFFDKQVNSSKLLVSAGEKDRSQFFHSMRTKVSRLLNKIKVRDSYIF